MSSAKMGMSEKVTDHDFGTTSRFGIISTNYFDP
jgi:hypothetical protein